MSLRKKTLIIVSLTIVTLVAILYGASEIILLTGFSKLEDQHIRNNVEQVVDSLHSDVSHLDSTTEDWAAWDDTYAFIDGKNNNYVRVNLVDSVFKTLRLNFILFIHSSGRIVFSKAFDLETEKVMPIPQSIQQHLSLKGPLLFHPHTKSSHAGILLLPEGPVLIASRPILTSENKGPIRGTLIFGRYLDSAEIKRLSEITHLSIAIYRFDDTSSPEVQEMRDPLSKDVPILVRTVSEQTIAGYTLLKDIYGKPALLLRVDILRDIYQQGQTSIHYFIFFLLITCLMFAVMIFFLLEKQVLSRLSRLSKSVSGIGKSADHSKRLSLPGEDELSRLASDINKMLKSLEESQKAIRDERDKAQKYLNVAGAIMIAFDIDHKVTLINKKGCEILGCEEEEVIGKNWGENFVPENIRDKVKELFNKLLAGEIEAGEYFENAVFTKSGAEKIIAWHNTLLTDDTENIFGILSSGEDITERKHMEESLRKNEAEIKEKIKELEEFYKMAVNRELRMIELKKEMNSLKKELSNYKKDTS